MTCKHEVLLPSLLVAFTLGFGSPAAQHPFRALQTNLGKEFAQGISCKGITCPPDHVSKKPMNADLKLLVESETETSKKRYCLVIFKPDEFCLCNWLGLGKVPALCHHRLQEWTRWVGYRNIPKRQNILWEASLPGVPRLCPPGSFDVGDLSFALWTAQ